MIIVPIGMKAANEYVAAHHRHHKPVRGCKFCVSVENENGECCGVAICGRPVSRYLDNGTTLEINRLCTNGTRNVCSMLYGACVRAAKALGYKKVITYTLASETGASLKAKHLAVKPTFAERFVRLKTLGEAYLPKNLEQRISEREKFTDAVRDKFKTANTIEKKFHVTVMDMVIEIKQFHLAPRKLDERKIYAFKNDANIDYLSRQLMTLSEFGLSSREKIYEKADGLKRTIDEITASIRTLTEEIPTLKSDISQLGFLFAAHSSKPDAMTQTKIAAAREIAEKRGVKTEADIENLEKRLKVLPDLITSAKNEVADEQLKLKRVSDLITAYEKIVEGNYIDNLIRAQKEQEQSRTAESPNLIKS